MILQPWKQQSPPFCISAPDNVSPRLFVLGPRPKGNSLNHKPDFCPAFSRHVPVACHHLGTQSATEFINGRLPLVFYLVYVPLPLRCKPERTCTRPVICQRDCFLRDSIEHGGRRLRKSIPRTKLKIDPGGFGVVLLVLVLTALVPTALVLVLTASSLEGAFGPDGVGFVLFCSTPKELLCLALLFRRSRRWFWC